MKKPLNSKPLTEWEIERNKLSEMAKKANQDHFGLIELEHGLINQVSSLFFKHSFITNSKIVLSDDIRLEEVNNIDFKLYSYFMVRSTDSWADSIPARYKEELLSLFINFNIKETDFNEFRKDLTTFNKSYSMLVLYLKSKNDISYYFDRNAEQMITKTSNYIFLG
jgi:hypothetical protein